jgi:hypothetical protein
MTPLDQALCAELRTLTTLRAELAGQRQGLEHELHVAAQVDRQLATQVEALTCYLLTCGPDVQAAVAALGGTHDGGG